MIEKLFDFIRKSPTVYQAVETSVEQLKAAGFEEMPASGELREGGKYYVQRYSALVAFVYRRDAPGFMISAAHGDSPAYRLRVGCEKGAADYSVIDVEKYGGMMHYTWFDRPLSLAGRVCFRRNGKVVTQNINIDRDLLVIPSLCIHYDRNANENLKPDVAKDMRPLFSATKEGESVLGIIAAQLGIAGEDIISHDLFTYVRQPGVCFGADNAFYLVPRLDDLGSVFATLGGFLASADSRSVKVFALFDNEEVGSGTKQGAASTFLRDVLERVGGENYVKMLGNSLMVSADNGHATHPNHAELSDSKYGTHMGEGFMIKYNAAQKYTTDGLSHALFSEICAKAGIKPQVYYTKANMAGGSTLGSISDTKVPVMSVDIGLPELAMHSAVETGAVRDLEQMVNAMKVFFESSICETAEGFEIN